MTLEQFQQLLAILGQIGTTAYQAAVQRAYVDGAIGTVFFLALAILTWKGISVRTDFFARAIAPDARDRESESGEFDFIKMAVGAVKWILVFLFLAFAVNDIIELLSPQYAALQYLSRLVAK